MQYHCAYGDVVDKPSRWETRGWVQMDDPIKPRCVPLFRGGVGWAMWVWVYCKIITDVPTLRPFFVTNLAQDACSCL
jgi:hypothetical protein